MNRLVWPFFFAWLTAAFLWPAEGAINGHGLTYVALLCLTVIVLAVCRGRLMVDDKSDRLWCFDWADAGVILLALGHWLSTGWVFLEHGDCRAALNLSLEWFGLTTFWFLIRGALLDKPTRIVCLAVVTSVVTGIAVLGAWQHHVEHDQRSGWYLELRTRLDELHDSGEPRDLQQAAQLRAELRDAGALWEGAERAQFEQRLLYSTEALGTYALANTLAGVLIVPLLLLAQAMLNSGRIARRSPVTVVIVGLCLIVLMYCLVLTKSRSAWLGTTVGVSIILARAVFRSQAKRLLVWGSVLGSVGVLAGVAGLLSGAIDREVVLEAPRSIQYRLFYWVGTAGVLEESPLFGTGPGNFRQSYLQFKLPESSEAIADPHNLFLDAWVSGGLIGLCGLLVLLTTVIRRGFCEQDESNSPSPASMISLRYALVGIGIGSSLPWVNGLFAFTAVDPFSGGQWIVPVIAFAVMPAMVRFYTARQTSGFAASAALVVHLFAAGSLQFPILVLLLYICFADVVNRSHSGAAGLQLRRTPARGLGVAAAVSGLVVVIVWGVLPVQRSTIAVARGLYEQNASANPAAAEKWFAQAVSADPLSVDPRQHAAALRAYQVGQVSLMDGLGVVEGDTEGAIREALDGFLDALDQWHAADRRSVNPLRLRAQVLFATGQRLEDDTLLQQGIDDLAAVVQGNPTSVRDWFSLAQCLAQAPSLNSGIGLEKAVNTARELDRINREWGHTDLYLTEDESAWLRATEGGSEIDPSSTDR